MTPTTHERWLPVVGFAGYEVSDRGRVRSVDRLIQSSTGPRRLRGRVLSPARQRGTNRPRVALRRDGRYFSVWVPSMVLTAFVGPRPTDAYALHNDGDAANNHLGNLRWGTPSENNADAVRHGTHSETRKTYCPRSHPLQAPNLVPSMVAVGARSCLACSRAHNNARERRQRGRALDFQAAADQHYRRIMQNASTGEP